MLYLTTIAFAALAALNARAGRSVVYPPALFCCVWTILLAGLIISGDTFYPLSAATLAVYLCGALAFSVGGFITLRRSPAEPKYIAVTPAGRWPQRILNWGLPVFVMCLPFYWQYVKTLSEASGISNFWRGVRLQSIAVASSSAHDGFGAPATLFGNLVTLVIVFALIAYREKNTSRKTLIRSRIYLAVALIYSLMSASSAAAASFLLAIVGMECVRERQIRLRTLLACVSLFLLTFSIVGIALEKGNARTGLSVSDNLPALVELVQVYCLGGVVAFDKVVLFPDSVLPTWSVSRFFWQAANKLGGTYDLPALHAEFTMVSSTMSTNVYTMFFSYYPDFGLIGTSVVMLLLGTVLSLVYLRACEGRSPAAILYGILFAGIVLSGFNENFFLALSFLLKIAVVSVVFYRVLTTAHYSTASH